MWIYFCDSIELFAHIASQVVDVVFLLMHLACVGQDPRIRHVFLSFYSLFLTEHCFRLHCTPVEFWLRRISKSSHRIKDQIVCYNFQFFNLHPFGQEIRAPAALCGWRYNSFSLEVGVEICIPPPYGYSCAAHVRACINIIFVWCFPDTHMCKCHTKVILTQL